MATIRERLRAAILEHGGFAAVAERLGVTDAYLYQICTGTLELGKAARLLADIEALLGIAMAEWFSDSAA